MKKIVSSVAIAALSVNLAACSNMSKQDVGTVSGGVIGGLVGSQFGQGNGKLLAVGVGALAGALIGGAIGKDMDANDKQRMNQALEANQVGQPAYWKNNNTGSAYTVVPTKNVSVDGNQYCREYRTTAIISGKKQQMYGTACRQPDGAWKMVSDN
jgi:surface antigen